MQVVLMGIFVICITGMLFCAFMLFRNKWVLDNRLKVLDRRDGSYGRLPSYDHMLRSHVAPLLGLGH